MFTRVCELLLLSYPIGEQIGDDEAAAAHVDEVLLVGFGEGGSGGFGYGGVGASV